MTRGAILLTVIRAVSLHWTLYSIICCDEEPAEDLL